MLTIYSASAGTGKTHTLTGEYLSLLFKGEERHRHILAVTFTNKATAEMKSRIIEELFRLDNYQPSDYITLLSDNGTKNETFIRERAHKILQSILHDYSAFHISTIDHFFQQTLRAFTREIGLHGNYQVELDPDLMIEKAVENMLAELEKSENATLMDWLLQFMGDKIEEGSGWNIRYDILKLSDQLFKETYKAHSSQIQKDISQKQLLADYRDMLYRIIQTTRKKAKSLGEQGVLLMFQHGMQPDDFFNASRSPFHLFERLAEGSMEPPSDTFYGLADHVEAYLAKTASPQLQHAAARIYAGGMNELVRSVISFFDNLTDYHTAYAITRHFYTLGILTDLSRHIAQWREDNNKLFIADTTELLNNIIAGSDIPFIYEKTGARIEHYMIDEFQDTSQMQWSNFRPLLKESLDHGRSNLIVGDVKQSIYRFRNSDWKLLERQVKIDFEQQVNEISLDVNWRSHRHIVDCNNRLFDTIPAILQQIFNEEVEASSLSNDEQERFRTSIGSVYKNAGRQVMPPGKQKEGHVRIQFLSDEDEQSWKEQSMQQLPQVIERLQDNGYALRDMAILTRSGNEGLTVAETLLNYKETHPESRYKYDIISEDTLTVGASRSIRWMVAMIRHLNQPDNINYREMAQIAYAMLQIKKQFLPEAIPSINPFIQPFRPEVIEQLKQLSHRSLYELAEGLFRFFEGDFPENELVYVQAFLDTIAEFTAAETGDAGQFLAWWDETGYTKKIVTPDSQNAIRIMTIHKSKGLGFKVVIIPFGDWNIDQKNTILWLEPSQKPFDAMSMVPVRYSKTLKHTIFARGYFTEKLHACIDNLNVLYVAFTRAKEELIVWAPQPKEKTKSETISVAGLLWNSLVLDPQFPLAMESGLYERGGWQMSSVIANPQDEALLNGTPAEKSSVENAFAVAEEWQVEHFYSLSPDNRLSLRQRYKNGFFDDEKRKYGLLMHDILSRIEKREDITLALSEKFSTGEISRNDVIKLKAELYALTDSDEVRTWFDGSMQVMNEVEILFDKGRSLRPDRIMLDHNHRVILVDYKFGDQKETIHQRQIEQYIISIRAMGYQNVTGYLWYFTLQEIQKIIF